MCNFHKIFLSIFTLLSDSSNGIFWDESHLHMEYCSFGLVDHIACIGFGTWTGWWLLYSWIVLPSSLLCPRIRNRGEKIDPRKGKTVVYWNVNLFFSMTQKKNVYFVEPKKKDMYILFFIILKKRII